MSSEDADSDVDSVDEGSTFMHRLEMIRDLIEAPDEAIEALYDQYGKSMVYTAGGAVGAAAGIAVGGPVGGLVGGVVGKKTAGKFTNQDGPIFSENAPSAVGAYPHAHRVGNLIFVSGIGPRQAVTDEIPGGPIRDGSGLSTDVVIEWISIRVTNRSTRNLIGYGLARSDSTNKNQISNSVSVWICSDGTWSILGKYRTVLIGEFSSRLLADNAAD
jgi:hypothetical protein